MMINTWPTRDSFFTARVKIDTIISGVFFVSLLLRNTVESRFSEYT